MNFLVKHIRLIFKPLGLIRYQHLRKLDYAQFQSLLACLSQLEQSYVGSNDRRFQGLSQQCERLLSEDNEYTQRFRFLPIAMRAAQEFMENRDFEAARDSYKEAIEDVEKIRAQLLKRQRSIKVQRNLGYFTNILALLNCNLGETLARLDAPPEDVERSLDRAVQLQPKWGYILDKRARYYVEKGRWDEAEQAFRELARNEPGEESEAGLKDNLAFLAIEKAQAMYREGEQDAAITLLENEIPKLHKAGLHAWEGKHRYNLAVFHEMQERNESATQEFAAGAECYARARSFVSASFLTESRADLEVKLGRYSQALESYQAALDYAERDYPKDSDDVEESAGAKARRQARLWTRIGLLRVAVGMPDAANEALQSSRQLVPPEEWFNPYDRMVTEARPLLERDDLFCAMKILLHSRLRKAGDSDLERRSLVEALRSLFDSSSRLVTKDYATAWTPPGQDITWINVVTPIVAEIDEATLDGLGGPDEVIQTLAPAMRDRLNRRYGIKIPGIRLRANAADLPTGTYVLMINEVPKVSGQVPSSGGVIVADERALGAAGLKGLEPAAESWIERSAFRGSDSDLAKARSAGLEAWSPLEVMMQHLEVLLTTELIEFLGHQETQNLLADNKLISNDRTDELIEREAYAHMDPLTRVLRSLASERVPITEFKEIYRRFTEGRSKGDSPAEIVRDIRNAPSVSPQLWGNSAEFKFAQLGPGITERIRQAKLEGGGEMLALEPEDAQEILTALRTVISEEERWVLVVPGQGLRAVVRGLIQLEYPNVPVLSVKELLPGLGSGIEHYIDV